MTEHSTLSAQEIRAVRIANGISQTDFAEYLGIPKSTYTKWEYHKNMYSDVRAKATNALIELGADLTLRREETTKFQRAIGHVSKRKKRIEYAKAKRHYHIDPPEEVGEVFTSDMVQAPDVVNAPDHYHKGGIDVLEYAERKLPRDQNIGFYRINVLKYVTRYDSKNGLEDLLKAQYYLEKLIKAEQQEE